MVNPITGLVHVTLNHWSSLDTFLAAVDFSTSSLASLIRLQTAVDPAREDMGGLKINPNTGRLYLMSVGEGPIVILDRPSYATPTNAASGPVTTTTKEVALTFDSVTSSGTTTITQVDPTVLPLQVPGQFTVSGALAYEISTTSTVTGTIRPCFNVSSIDDRGIFDGLAILHGENGAWVDRTFSRDFDTRTICAQVSSLSPFVVARRVPVPDGTAPVTSVDRKSVV